MLLSVDLLAEATRTQSEGYCPILHEEVAFGLGFKPTVPRRPFGPNPRSFGHFGTGGAVGFADPDADAGLRLRDEPRDPALAEHAQPGPHRRGLRFARAVSFEELVAEGTAVPVEGWDFSWFDGRATEERPPWAYARLMEERMARRRRGPRHRDRWG